MGDNSKIEWTDASWNPVTGCSKVSPGCKNCYAERMSRRLNAMGARRYSNGFKVTLHPDLVDLPMRWTRGRRIFVNSMSDLFHRDVPFSFIEQCCKTMTKADHHVYQVLTKRPERMVQFTKTRMGGPWPEHVWVGTTVEGKGQKDRIKTLRKVPAAIRFISFEPLLSPIGNVDLRGISWAIVGGESGPNSRPMKPEWARKLRETCAEQGVPFFFKQWGGTNKKAAGRILDGRTWDEYPDAVCISETPQVEGALSSLKKRGLDRFT